jgi:small subunit ribosomal protein S6
MVTNKMLDVNGEKPSIHKGKIIEGSRRETGTKILRPPLLLCYLPTLALADPAYLHLAPSWSGGLCPGGFCMELYESLFIIRPSVSDEETNALIEKMKSVADKTGAQFIKSENWGRKKLAYEVRRERKGTYVYFYFKAPNNTVGELEHAYRLEDNIIKFLTVHLEKELVPRRVEAPSEEFTGGRI